MITTIKLPEISTPWGFSTDYRELAPGVLDVATPSHGGLILDEARQAQVAAIFPGFVPWGGSLKYLEEDCDIVIGVAVFADCFAPEMRLQSFEILRADIARRNYYKVSTGQLEALMGTDDTGQPFVYDVAPLPAL